MRSNCLGLRTMTGSHGSNQSFKKTKKKKKKPTSSVHLWWNWVVLPLCAVFCLFISHSQPKFEIAIPKHTNKSNKMKWKAQTFSSFSSSAFSFFFIFFRFALSFFFNHQTPVTSTQNQKPSFFYFSTSCLSLWHWLADTTLSPCEELDMWLPLHLSFGL